MPSELRSGEGNGTLAAQPLDYGIYVRNDLCAVPVVVLVGLGLGSGLVLTKYIPSAFVNTAVRRKIAGMALWRKTFIPLEGQLATTVELGLLWCRANLK